MIGKWIDRLDAEQKDRIITGQGWCVHSIQLYEDRCLVGHAIGGLPAWRNLGGDIGARLPLATVGRRFDGLCDRFGMDRIVRACKLRAAKSHRVVLPDAVPVEEAVPA